MLNSVVQLLRARPFRPFVVVTTAGLQYRVESPDHAHLNPLGTRVTIYLDDDSQITIAGLHIASLELPAEAGSY